MSKWPKTPDAAPSADQIARALWAAADLTGEREYLAELARTSPASSAGVVLRARWPAIAALNELWPRCSLDALGRVLGSKAGMAGVLSAKRTTWWPTPRELAAIGSAA